jgi:hypothetical protein
VELIGETQPVPLTELLDELRHGIRQANGRGHAAA